MNIFRYNRGGFGGKVDKIVKNTPVKKAKNGDLGKNAQFTGDKSADLGKIADFLAQIRADFPMYKFCEGKRFMFRPPRTIMVEKPPKTGVEIEQKIYTMQLMHELGHAILEHRDFSSDLRRLKMERDAWVKARELCVRYQIEFSEEIAESELDTYREWLHQRSKCPKCGVTRYQVPNGEYRCPECEDF